MPNASTFSTGTTLSTTSMPALKDVQDDVVVANQSALRYADCTRLAKIILKDFLGESGDHPDDDAPEKEHDVQDTGDLHVSEPSTMGIPTDCI